MQFLKKKKSVFIIKLQPNFVMQLLLISATTYGYAQNNNYVTQTENRAFTSYCNCGVQQPMLTCFLHEHMDAFPCMCLHIQTKHKLKAQLALTVHYSNRLAVKLFVQIKPRMIMSRAFCSLVQYVICAYTYLALFILLNACIATCINACTGPVCYELLLYLQSVIFADIFITPPCRVIRLLIHIQSSTQIFKCMSSFPHRTFFLAHFCVDLYIYE